MNEPRVGVISVVNTVALCIKRASVFKLEKAHDTLIKKQRGRRMAAGQRLVLQGFPLSLIRLNPSKVISRYLLI